MSYILLYQHQHHSLTSKKINGECVTHKQKIHDPGPLRLQMWYVENIFKNINSSLIFDISLCFRYHLLSSLKITHHRGPIGRLRKIGNLDNDKVLKAHYDNRGRHIGKGEGLGEFTNLFHNDL